jgi:hypothetical protein
MLAQAEWSKLGENAIQGIEDLHRKFIEEDIWGFDSMGFAAHLAMVNLALQLPQGIFRTAHVYLAPVSVRGKKPLLGSLEFLQKDSIPLFFRLDEPPVGAVQQAAREKAEEVEVPRASFDFVVMNPPFTRGDRAAQLLKVPLLNKVLENIGWSELKVQETGLAAPFVILADLYVKPGGRIAFVIPTAIMSRETWKPVRQLLLRGYHIEHIIVSWADGTPSFSEDTALREALLVARKLGDRESPGPTVLSHIDEVVTFLQAREAGEILAKFSRSTGQPLIDPRTIDIGVPSSQTLYSGRKPVGESKSVPPALLKATDNWYQFVAFRKPDLVVTCLAINGVAPAAAYGIEDKLLEIVAPLDASLGGVATVQWYMRYTEAAGYRVASSPSANSIPYLHTSAYGRLTFKQEDYDHWIARDPSIVEPKKSFPLQPARLHVCRKTNVYSTMRIAACISDEPVIGSMWHPVNVTGLQTSDGAEITSVEACRLLTLWFQSTYGLVALFGSRAGTEGAYGEWKTDQIKNVRALDPTKLTHSQVDTILSVWNDMADFRWGLIREQLAEAATTDHPRRRLDETLATAIAGSVPNGLTKLYRDLHHTVERLGAVMGGRTVGV